MDAAAFCGCRIAVIAGLHRAAGDGVGHCAHKAAAAPIFCCIGLHRRNVTKTTKLSLRLAVFRWGARTVTWKPASNTFTAGTLGNSRGWKRWSPHWMIDCGFVMG